MTSIKNNDKEEYVVSVKVVVKSLWTMMVCQSVPGQGFEYGDSMYVNIQLLVGKRKPSK